MKMVKNTCLAKRAGEHEEEIEITELVPGDIVYLAAGDMVPADIRIIDSKDLFISQASLTGESETDRKVSGGTGTTVAERKCHRVGQYLLYGFQCDKWCGKRNLFLKRGTNLSGYYCKEPGRASCHYSF